MSELTYSSEDDVKARLGARPLTSESAPSLEQVKAWLVEAEAQVEGALRSRSITIPVTDTRGIEIIKSKVVDYAEGLARQVYASTGNGADDDGLKCLERFVEFMKEIRENPADVAAMLGATASEDSTARFRSSFLDDDAPAAVFTRRSKQ